MNILRITALLAAFALFAVTASATEPVRGHHIPPGPHPGPGHGHDHDWWRHHHHDHDWWRHHHRDHWGWDRYHYGYGRYGYPYSYGYQYTVPYTYQYRYLYPPTYVPEVVENVYPKPLQVLPQPQTVEVPQPLPVQQVTEQVPILVWYLAPGGVWQYHECETPEVVESYVYNYRQLGYEVKVLRADQPGHPGRFHHYHHHHPVHHHPGHHHPGHHHPGHHHHHPEHRHPEHHNR